MLEYVRTRLARYFVYWSLIAIGVLLIVRWGLISRPWETNLVSLTITKGSLVRPSQESGDPLQEVRARVLPAASEKPALARLYGVYYLNQDEVDQAVQVLQYATPGDRIAMLWLGQAYERQGRTADAVSAWQRAGAAGYFLTLGQDSYGRQDFVRACLHYRHAVEIAPELARAQMYVGDCYFRLGDFAAAEHSYRRAITLDPEDGKPYINLSNLYSVVAQRPDQAAAVLRDCTQHAQSLFWRDLCRQSLADLAGTED